MNSGRRHEPHWFPRETSLRRRAQPRGGAAQYLFPLVLTTALLAIAQLRDLLLVISLDTVPPQIPVTLTLICLGLVAYKVFARMSPGALGSLVGSYSAYSQIAMPSLRKLPVIQRGQRWLAGLAQHLRQDAAWLTANRHALPDFAGPLHMLSLALLASKMSVTQPCALGACMSRLRALIDPGDARTWLENVIGVWMGLLVLPARLQLAGTALPAEARVSGRSRLPLSLNLRC